MGTLLYLIVTGISLSMFFIGENKKLCLLIFYAMCLATVNMPSHFMGVYLLPQLFFFLSEISKCNRYYKRTPRPIVFILSLTALGAIVLYFSSVHLEGFWGFFSILKVDLITKYFAIAYAFLAVRNNRDMTNIVNTMSFAVFLLTFFGLLNLLTRHAIFVDWAMEGAKLNDTTELLGSKFSKLDRFRVQSMHFNPFFYGYICSVTSIFILFLKNKNLLNRKSFYFLSAGCLFGVLSCSTRTVLFCFIVSHTIFYVLTHRVTKSVFVFCTLVVALYIATPYVPFLNDKLRFVGSIFESEEKSEVTGSSIEMRQVQYVAVLYHISGHELLGRGYNYFMIDMGWKDGQRGLKDNRLQGLEGVHLSLLLERGFLGLVIYLITWAVLLYLFWNYRNTDKNISSMCISVTSCYLMFAFMTGELGTLFFTMLLLSIGISIIKRKLLRDGRHINNNSKLQYT